MKKVHLKVSAVVALVLVCIVGAYAYLKHSETYPSTEDAYVKAHVIYIAAEVSGKVTDVHIHNHEQVKKGQLLIEIDNKSYLYASQSAAENLSLSKQEVKVSEEAIKVAENAVIQAKAQLEFAAKQNNRFLKLVKNDATAQSQADQVATNFKIAKTTLLSAHETLAQSKEQLAASQMKVKIAKTNLEQAKLNLLHTKIYAPTQGNIDQLKLRIGSMVSPGQSLFALVDTKQFWVEANYKETDLKRIKAGQKANVKIDMYPGITFTGMVDSISPGSGSTFALLPPENATGNWVKVTQRFPVKIRLNTQDNTSKHPFRVGASAHVTVDTR